MGDKAPIQVRLDEEDLCVLDRVVNVATAKMAGIKKASRPEALRWAFLTGAAAILKDAQTSQSVQTLSSPCPPADFLPVPEMPPPDASLDPAPALPDATMEGGTSALQDVAPPLSPDQEDEARKARSITPLQQVALASPPPVAVEDAAAMPVPELENSVDMGGADFDPAKFTFGKLCKGKHEYGQTGQTLLRLPARVCAQCESERRKQKRARQWEGKA